MNKLYEMARYVVESEYPYLNSLESEKLTNKLITKLKEDVSSVRVSPEQKMLDFVLKYRNPSIQDELTFNLMALAQKKNPKLAAELTKYRQNPQMTSKIFKSLVDYATNLPEGKRAIRLAYSKALRLPREKMTNSQPNNLQPINVIPPAKGAM